MPRCLLIDAVAFLASFVVDMQRNVTELEVSVQAMVVVRERERMRATSGAAVTTTSAEGVEGARRTETWDGDC